MNAILFGSMSTIADTSELQRAAFNEAFAEHGLDWQWDRDEYRELLQSNGGEQRIAEQASAKGEQVDAAAVHRTKSKRFQQRLAADGATPRAGVVETVRAARERGVKVALVTTTSPDNLSALFTGLGDALRRDDFDLVVDAAQVHTPKPDVAAYAYALQALGAAADESVAVEDNVGGVAAAVAAGVQCVAFPNENTAGHDFGDTRVVERITLDELQQR
ncbi:MAG: HAD-IA family hydrolase [Mycobacteriaceae bacterium]